MSNQRSEEHTSELLAVEIKQPSPDKLKALQLAMEKIEKDHGRGTIMRLGDENIEEVSVIPTGSVGLNLALGVGGYPRGRKIGRASCRGRV